MTEAQKQARRDAVKRYRLKNKALLIEKNRLWRLANHTRSAWLSRKSNLKFYYGMTLEEYESIIRAQQERCAICGEHMNQPHVDHDHKTGKVRGLLCRRCNPALGGFKDDPRILMRAIAYLEQHNKQNNKDKQ